MAARYPGGVGVPGRGCREVVRPPVALASLASRGRRTAERAVQAAGATVATSRTMDTILRRYMWALNLAAIGGCALFLAHAAARSFDPVDQSPPRPLVLARAQPPRPRAPIDRNIFCSSCGDSGPPPLAVPSRSELPVALVATMCAPAAPGSCPLALVRGLDDRSLRAFGGGGRLREATITEIQPTRVYLDRSGRRESLQLLPGATADPVGPFEPVRPTPASEA